MKVTTPTEVNAVTSQMIEDAIAAFEKEFESESKSENYYHLVIEGELSRAVCDEVEKVYKNAGWLKVRCRTSSENGERGGLTGLKLESK